MKASFALALAGSLLAVASPIDKRAIYTEYVTDVVYVTVTVDPPTHHHTATHHRVKPTTTSVPTTTTTVPTTTSVPTTTPVPTTTSTPATTPTPVPTPTTSSTTEVETITITQGAATTSAAAAAPTTEAAAAEQPAAEQATTEAATSTKATSTKAAQTSTTKAATSQPTDYSSTAVYHHNIHRANHSAPAVSWNSDLASYAATVAATCKFAHDLTPGASTGAYGQNIAAYGASGDIESRSSSDMVAQAITDMWYNGEVWQFPSDGYGESSPDMTNFESWGHFSQVVWVASTEIGCASQYCAPGTIYSGLGSWFTVCDYRSEGNIGGAYGTNVLPSLGEAAVTA